MSSKGDTQSTLTGLRPGRGALSRGEVEGIQRTRLLSAMVDVAAEDGFLGASVGRVVERAGISRRTFYELFDSREDCFLGAFEWGVQQARVLMTDAYAQESTWRNGVRRALATQLAFLDSEPKLARVCVVEALAAGALVLDRRALVLDELACALKSSAPRRRGGEPPLLTEEGIVGGAFSVVHTRMLAPGGAPLADLLGQLMALIVLPYLGARAGGEELMRPPPELPPRQRASARGERVLEHLGMRLTYRTVRCLLYIAAHPGVSNRELALGAEIADEGQASKLLMRLAGLELITKDARGPGRPNAWRITGYGEQVLRAIDGR